MDFKLRAGELFIIRLACRLSALGVGYLVYRKFGFWPGAGAAIAAWLLLSAVFGSIVVENKFGRRYSNCRRDID